jgi:methenyltetrahydromethanopterin cyclohydrolase
MILSSNDKEKSMQEMQDYSLNQAAVGMIQDVIARADEYQIHSWKAKCGSTLVDMGLNCPGSWKAGQAFVEIGYGGLGKATYGKFEIGHFTVPSIDVWVDHPVLAVVASQAGCWELGRGELAMIGSGPARAVALADRWAGHGYRDTKATKVVVQLQTNRVPSDDLCLAVANACHVAPDEVYVVFAPTACLVGAVQVASRTVEQVMIKLFLRGFDIHTVKHGFGMAPVAPLVKDEVEAMGRANDALFYGATTVLYADAPDEVIAPIVEGFCFDVNSGEFWGTPFVSIFRHFHCNWFEVPDLIDSPAKLIINSLQTGHSFVGGQINLQVLSHSYFGVDLP